MRHEEIKVRRKSLWRSKNSKADRKFANMRAAKERKRMAAAFAEPEMPDASHVIDPEPAKPLFVVTIRCSDGESVRLKLFDGPFGLFPPATLAQRKIGCVLKNYRPIYYDQFPINEKLLR